MLLPVGWFEVLLLDSLKTLSPTLPRGGQESGIQCFLWVCRIWDTCLGLPFPVQPCINQESPVRLSPGFVDYLWLCRQNVNLIQASSLASSWICNYSPGSFLFHSSQVARPVSLSQTSSSIMTASWVLHCIWRSPRIDAISTHITRQ